MDRLFEPYVIGSLGLSNRIVMAPLTRRRAENSALAPNLMMAEYYRQRASAGLIISEGSQVSPPAYGYTNSPGCYTSEQLTGWKRVTRAVHEGGGKIFLQLWHVGPFSHRLLQPGNRLPLSASPVKPDGLVLTPQGRIPYEWSQEMNQEDIREATEDFGLAARNAMEAGFDGVEIHAAHAYLIDQFLMDGTNRRTDQYGGGIENRSRFLFEVVRRVLEDVDPGRVGIRLSPRPFKIGMGDSDPVKTYGYVVEKLNDYKLAYLHISERMEQQERMNDPVNSIVPLYRGIWRGALISCGGHTPETAARMVESGEADLIAFGKPYISNPDLVERIRQNLPLAEADKETFYHGGARGYTDYPVYSG
jgi:N-ethylmaleimide reductase